MSLHWLAGNTHKLGDYNWGAVCMGRAMDIFHKLLLKIIERPALGVCEMDMMSIFGELLDKLPPFREWWDYMWKEKEMNVVHHKSGTKVMPMKIPRTEIFKPTTQDNINSTPFVIEFLGVIFAEVDKEMKDQKKVTIWNMSFSGSPRCYDSVL